MFNISNEFNMRLFSDRVGMSVRVNESENIPLMAEAAFL